jgi:hypothetical protein
VSIDPTYLYWFKTQIPEDWVVDEADWDSGTGVDITVWGNEGGGKLFYPYPTPSGVNLCYRLWS